MPVPILTVVILTTTIMPSIFLIIYCAFTLRSRSNLPRQPNLVDRFLHRILFSQQEEDDSFIALSPVSWQNQGLGLTRPAIYEIPTFRYTTQAEANHGQNICLGSCAVCLNEFQEKDILRALPNCSHAFHSDCINVWLTGSSNCPLCRTGISGVTVRRTDEDIIAAPSSSPQSYPESLLGGDENFIVIELMGSEEIRHPLSRNRSNKCNMNGSSMGDEFIDVLRDQISQDDDSSIVKPMIRRSFSLDSAAERHLCLSVREAVRGYNKSRAEASGGSSEGYNGKFGRFFFSFSQARRSRNIAVRPLDLGP